MAGERAGDPRASATARVEPLHECIARRRLPATTASSFAAKTPN